MSALRLQVVESTALSFDRYREIVRLCNAAYRQDLTELMATFGPRTHVLGIIDAEMVAHAMWVTRWLQEADAQPLKTAYVEAVATLPAHQNNGYATHVMRRLAQSIPASYAAAALSPATTRIYTRLGWQFWRGSLSIRLPSGEHRATPDESVMVLPLPGRPALNLDRPLSAEWREGEVW